MSFKLIKFKVIGITRVQLNSFVIKINNNIPQDFQFRLQHFISQFSNSENSWSKNITDIRQHLGAIKKIVLKFD